MLAAAAMNFKRMMNKWKLNPGFFIFLKGMHFLFKNHKQFFYIFAKKHFLRFN